MLTQPRGSTASRAMQPSMVSEAVGTHAPTATVRRLRSLRATCDFLRDLERVINADYDARG